MTNKRVLFVITEEGRSEEKRLSLNVNCRYLSFVIIGVCIVLSYFEMKILISGYSLNSGNTETTITMLGGVNSKLDYRINANLGKAYLKEYEMTKDKGNLSIAIEKLEKTYENDFNAKRNLVHAYKASGSLDLAIEEAKNIVLKVKYCELDYAYLEKLSNDKEILEWIESSKIKNRASLNSKAKYIKNQIK